MKIFKTIVLFLSCVFLFAIFTLSALFVSAEIAQSAVFNVVLESQSPSNGIFTWLGDNWVVVALVLSEVAALLPSKYKGIVQGAITFIGSLFAKPKPRGFEI